MTASPLFAAIDIGNTTVTMGIFSLHSLEPLRVLRIGSQKQPSSREILLPFHRARLDPRCVSGAAIASVVPSLDRPFQKLVQRLFGEKALLISHRINTGVKIRTEIPSQVGADRIVNACAAHRLFGRKTIVVDFGTAATFDCVNSKGEYLGGVICPGPKLSATALAHHTAKLPLVKMAKPPRIIGKNTADCIRSGLFYGYIGLVREILRRIQTDMGPGALVVATGGDARLISSHTPEIDKVVPDLILIGIKIIWELNSRGGLK